MDNSSLKGIAIPFFSREEWERARRLMPDGHTFGPYDEFVLRVDAMVEQLRAKGTAAIRIHIDTDEFIAWCKGRGAKIDSQSRAHFAALMAKEADRGRRDDHT